MLEAPLGIGALEKHEPESELGDESVQGADAHVIDSPIDGLLRMRVLW